MKKAHLSAVAIAAALALPGSPARAQSSEIAIGITHYHNRAGGSARHSRTQCA